MSTVVHRTRRKTVWGRTPWLLASAFMVFALTGMGNVSAKNGDSNSSHSGKAAKAQPGVPSSRVNNYKVDDELKRRRDVSGSSRVIVALVPGASLPSDFKRFSVNRNLDIINGQVLDLPNGMIKQLESLPD